jgi:recombination protein RecT
MAEMTVQDARRGVVTWLNDPRIEAEIKRALPAHVPVEWFLRAAQTSILNNPALAGANKESLLRELVAVAQLGLVTDPQLGEAWLIVDSKGMVQRRVGYQGLRKLALQSGLVTALNAQAVYQNDKTEIELGDNPHVHHKIDVTLEDRGKLLGCYAVARIAGTDMPQVEWMGWKQIEAHRNRYSDAYKHGGGPWKDPLGEVEMARKTVFRRLAKWLPKSPVLAEALAHEDRLDMRDITPETRTLPAPDETPPDPMDRVVAEARGNGSASDRTQTAPEVPSSPQRQPAASTEQSKRGRRSYAEIQRDVLGEIESVHTEADLDAITESKDYGRLNDAQRDAVDLAIASKRTKLRLAKSVEMGGGADPDDSDAAVADLDGDPDTGEVVEVDDDLATWLDEVRREAAGLPAAGHCKVYYEQRAKQAGELWPDDAGDIDELVRKIFADRRDELLKRR